MHGIRRGHKGGVTQNTIAQMKENLKEQDRAGGQTLPGVPTEARRGAGQTGGDRRPKKVPGAGEGEEGEEKAEASHKIDNERARTVA